MGVAYSSCGGDGYGSIDQGLGTSIMRAFSFSESTQSSLRSVGFNGRVSEPAGILDALASRKLVVKGSLSFNAREMDPFRLETEISLTSDDGPMPSSSEPNERKPSRISPPPRKRALEQPPVSPDGPHHEAAVKLQKVYKSFRTRRLLADCAVLVEQRWWKLLDFALLKRSSVSFFDIERQESVVSKWSRARTRAAKVGKGLSKDEKAQKLALQHWLEAIDPRHRYGHNLHFHYHTWLRCESKQPFFYWLDVGDGKEVNLVEQCPRSKLQQQCIKYLGPKEREAYEVTVEDGKLMYKKSRQLINTTGHDDDDAKWIFVLSTTRTLYVGQKKKGTFQHSSFLAGGATSAAGRLVVEDGVLKAVWPHSGHYRPTEVNFQEFMSFLQDNNVDLSDVKTSPCEEDEGRLSTLSSSESELNLPEICAVEKDEEVRPCSAAAAAAAAAESAAPTLKEETAAAVAVNNCIRPVTAGSPAKRSFTARRSQMLHNEIVVKNLAVREDVSIGAQASNDVGPAAGGCSSSIPVSEQCIFRKDNLFAGEEEQEEANEEGAALIAREQILERINSKKGMDSYQLGKQLSFKWTTGAGPRIGCVRDYPSELRFRALEQVHLSPKGAGPSRYASNSPTKQLTGLSPRLPEISPSDEQKPPAQSKS